MEPKGNWKLFEFFQLNIFRVKGEVFVYSSTVYFSAKLDAMQWNERWREKNYCSQNWPENCEWGEGGGDIIKTLSNLKLLTDQNPEKLQNQMLNNPPGNVEVHLRSKQSSKFSEIPILEIHKLSPLRGNQHEAVARNPK